ncbi:MAG TPA: helix-turn-helix domain-containing protein [Rhodanobacteraceae bacterium]|nr:helix-turn-helix domain-containing protein [Rhodanobacteraceae bacterium]
MTDAELPLADLTGKARIRHVALHLFATRGCAQTPLRLIAEKARVSLALISHHFGTKHELRDAIEKYIVSSFEKAIDDIPEIALRRSDADAMRQLVESLERVLDTRPEIRGYIRRAASEAYTSAGGTALIDALIRMTQGALLRMSLAVGDRDGAWQPLQLFLLVFGPTLLEPALQRRLPDLFEHGSAQARLRSNVKLLQSGLAPPARTGTLSAFPIERPLRIGAQA